LLFLILGWLTNFLNLMLT